ncbi:hypothetical protein Hanom_Chr00s000394g01642281 [Helianthus anomalus]
MMISSQLVFSLRTTASGFLCGLTAPSCSVCLIDLNCCWLQVIQTKGKKKTFYIQLHQKGRRVGMSCGLKLKTGRFSRVWVRID